MNLTVKKKKCVYITLFSTLCTHDGGGHGEPSAADYDE